MMKRQDVIEALVRVRDGAPVISGPGTVSRLLWATKHEPASIYQMDMAYATAMSLGVALARPDLRRVVAIEGDGSIIAAMGVFSTIGRYKPKNFVVIVVDDGVYGSVVDGSVETASSHGTDIASVARGCGIDARCVRDVTSREGAEQAIAQAFAEPGPWILVMKVGHEDKLVMRNQRGIIPYDVAETAVSYRRALTNVS